MNEITNLFLVSRGVISAIGNSSPMTYSSFRAGISAYSLSPHRNKRMKHFTFANIPNGALEPLSDDLLFLEESNPSHSNLLKISGAALKECLNETEVDRTLPLFMACPEVLPGHRPKMGPDFLQHLNCLVGGRLNLNASRTTYSGRAGGLMVIQLAFKHMVENNEDLAIVGGVDSYQFCLQQISLLDYEERLLVEGSLDGFVPGEAGCFLLLASEKALEKHNLTPKLTMAYPSYSREEGSRYSSKPYLGSGLAEAFKSALETAPEYEINKIYSSLNGEQYGHKELGVAMIRNNSRISADADIIHPADCFGDIGASLGPTLLSLMSHEKKCSGLAYCSSDGEFRSAICAWK